MKKLILLFVLLHTAVFAYTHDDLIRDYRAENYKSVCTKSAVFYKNLEKNEEILSIIGDACAKIDYINPLGYIVRGLISTPKFRENGSYFATLVLQKKLIYQFMNDGIELKNLRLPRSEHVLSVVFEHLATYNYTKIGEKIVIKTDSKEYIVWISSKQKRVVHVEEYQHGKKIKTHRYL